MKLTSDFETTTDPNDTRVWAYGFADIYNENFFVYGNCIEDWYAWLVNTKESHTIYFHNLKFDGEFVIDYLLRLGYTHIQDKRKATSKSFTTLISGHGQFYSITIYEYRKGKNCIKYELIDSLKILPFAVKTVAEMYKLPIKKGNLDYSVFRKKGHKLTKEELEYLYNDVHIMARALKNLFDNGMDKMTQGSNALNYYKEETGTKFNKWFPLIDLDTDAIIRRAYKGGFTYCNPTIANKDMGRGIVLDVNSLYPYVMRYKLLPYGEPVYFDGDYINDPIYRIYILCVRCQFKLKDGHIPTIQLKNNSSFRSNEYVSSSENIDGYDEEQTLYLTNIDYEMFKKHYHIYNEEVLYGYKFKATYGLFNDYIDYWSEQKINSKKEDNHGMYVLSKLMLNALYGKFGSNPIVTNKIPYLCDEENRIKYKTTDETMKDPVYIPMACFITAYARELTINGAQANYDRFLYADTDSLHLLGGELPDNLNIDETKLGSWDHELNFIKARYIRQKCYMEFGSKPKKRKYRWKITCSGMPSGCYKYVNFSNFIVGSSFKGKLQNKHVKYGIVLEETDFTIKLH